MKAPGFWYRPPEAPGLWPRLLAPLGWLGALATHRRLARGPRHRPGVPVICVGNISVGGTGKTPTVITLLDMLARRKLMAHVVSRGHGGSAEGPLRVDLARHDARLVGDEPLLHAAFAPTWVAKAREEGAEAAVRAGAEVIVLDDGLQNPALAHDLSIVVVDAARGFGNERVMPAGPLREPVEAGLARADLLMVIGAPAMRERFLARQTRRALPPVIEGELKPIEMGIDWAGMPVLAFAGIGHPERFFATLEGLGAKLLAKVALADHHPISRPLLLRLMKMAQEKGAQLVTTEKDAVRLPADLRHEVLSLPVRLELVDAAPLKLALDRILARNMKG